MIKLREITKKVISVITLVLPFVILLFWLIKIGLILGISFIVVRITIRRKIISTISLKRIKFTLNVRNVEKIYYDPKIIEFIEIFLLINLFVAFVLIFFVYKDLNITSATNYNDQFPFTLTTARLLLNLFIGIITGENLSQISKFWGKTTILTGIVLNGALITFYLGAYKQKLDRKLRHSRLKDKPEGLQLRDHLLFIDRVEGVKAVIRNINNIKKFNRDIVIISEDLQSRPFVQIDSNLYDKIWGIEGDITDVDIAKLADLETASFTIFTNITSLDELMMVESSRGNGRNIFTFIAVEDDELEELIWEFLRVGVNE